jgi:hypothetical protein
MRLFAPLLPHRLIGPVMLAAACTLAAGRAQTADPLPTDDKAKPAETNKIELHRLKNDDVLKQASAIYDKAAQDYLAASRALASAELLLEQAARQADALEGTEAAGPPRAPGPSGKEPTAEDNARAAEEAAKTRLEAARQKLKRVQSRKDLLDRVAAGVDASRSAALAFLNALDDLKPYTIEIGLRVKDGSLTAAKVPPELSADALEKKRKDLADDQVKRQRKATDVPKAQAAVVRQLGEAN